MSEFHHTNKGKINKQCDIYSIGAILYKLLLGAPPSPDVSDYINKKRLNEKTPNSNVYDVPYFLKDFILSNDMCYILIRLLHYNPKYRYNSLTQLRGDLLNLRDNVYSTPSMMRQILGHPILLHEIN